MNTTLNRLRGQMLILSLTLVLTGKAWATQIIYDTWTSNEAPSGNYILTVNDDIAGKFDISLTVDPWNAEAFGLFIDFGDFDIIGGISSVGLSDISTLPTTTGSIALFSIDTTSDSCGSGCNLTGLSPPIADPDEQWELVFRLGITGYEGIQTWNFRLNDLGLAIGDWGLVGIRSQQLCSGVDTLPGSSEDCEDSDKSYGSIPHVVPEPASLFLLGMGLLGLGAAGRRRAK